MTQEIEITNLNGDHIAARIHGEFEVRIPRGPGGLVHEEAKVIIDPDQLQEAIDFASAELLERICYRPNGMELDGETIMGERRYICRGHIYRIRDRKLGDAVYRWEERCLYATKDEGGNTVWKPCSEGVEFDNIEPFEKAA
ncbi:hypothetical protein [Sinorhizobium meliloti]|uniref:hypothetical protein n=1 Tax=Rhizobium meliloti TaxID=382 RepID=UPI003D65FEB8